MQLNRKVIPDKLKENKNRELLSSEIYWDKNSFLSISSYVVKTSKGKKNVILLSTAPPILDITKDNWKSKLGIYKVYDCRKGGTDIIDQRMGFYTCKPKSRKWAITVFSYVIDMPRVNSSTTFALLKNYNPCKQDSFEYCYTSLYQLLNTIYTITKFEWPYYTCETKYRVGNRKKAMESGRWSCWPSNEAVIQTIKEDAMYVYQIWLG